MIYIPVLYVIRIGFRTVDYFNERIAGDTGRDTKFDNLRRKLFNGRTNIRRRYRTFYTRLSPQSYVFCVICIFYNIVSSRALF